MKKSPADRDDIVDTLKKSKLFSGINDEGLLEISSFFNKVDFQNDQFIFMEGDPSDWLYVVSTKKVKIIKHSESGRDVIVEMKSPGEMFCCAAVLDKKPLIEFGCFACHQKPFKVEKTESGDFHFYNLYAHLRPDTNGEVIILHITIRKRGEAKQL